jgi:hypothetical protein
MTQLASELVIAFTITVVGLALGMLAFFFYTVKRRSGIPDRGFGTQSFTDNDPMTQGVVNLFDIE